MNDFVTDMLQSILRKSLDFKIDEAFAAPGASDAASAEQCDALQLIRVPVVGVDVGGAGTILGKLCGLRWCSLADHLVLVL